MPSPIRPLFRILWWLPAIGIVIALCLLRWGGNLLIASDTTPPHVDAAIVLQGSITAQRVRIAGAIGLLQRGVADRALLSVPKEGYWGQVLLPIARSYLERNYGTELSSRVDFCQTDEDVDSTIQEAQAIGRCIREHNWQSIVVVTSSYHTRRAGMIWRKISKNDPNLRLWINGVSDPSFQQPWWRHRESAKIWVTETLKLFWSALGGE